MNTHYVNNSKIQELLVVAMMAIAGVAASAQETSSTQDVTWDADGEVTMTVSDNIRTINLLENVVITQGTLKIFGDRAIMEYDEPTREFSKVTVYGSPVNYQQELDSSGSTVTGNSESIQLYTEEASGDTIIELTGNAYIQSPDSTMNCAAILYLPDNDLIRKATGPCTGTLSQTEQ